MTWLIWNVGGINKRHKQKELKFLLKSRKIRIVGLVETRVKQQNVNKISSNILPVWGIITNHQSNNNGRIWFARDPNVYKAVAIHITSQLIHCSITDMSGSNT